MANELATAYIQLLPSFRGLKDEIRKGLADTATEAKRAGQKSGDAFNDGFGRSSAPDMGAEDLSRSYGVQGEKSAASFNDGLSSGLGDMPGSIDDALGAAFDGLPPGIGAAALAVGAAAGALLVQGFGDALERLNLNSQLEASLGVSDAKAADLGKRAGSIYAQNYGESVAQVTDATATVQRSFGGQGLGADELDKITKAALTTSTVFKEDLGQSVNAASQLIRTGLVNDSTEAFDLITVGLQGTANKSGDLLDTFNEYSTQFRKLGLSGKDALNLITQAVNAGARDSDIAADAIGEFTKRAVDGTTTTAQAFATLGIEDAANRIAKGGKTARDAFQETLVALGNVEDPALRAQVAFNLFGTQSEDLGAALATMDLDTTVSGLERIPGAAQKAQDSFDDLSSNIEVLKRSFTGEIANSINDLLSGPAAALKDDSSWTEIGVASAKSFWSGFTTFVPVSGIVDALTNELRAAAGLVFGSGINDILTLATGGGTPQEAAAPDSKLAARLKGEDTAAANAADGLDEYDKAAKEAGVSQRVAADGANAITNALARAGSAGKLSAVGLQAAASAADTYLASVENATRADDTLAAGLKAGSAINSLLEGAGVKESSSDRRAAARERAVEADRIATEQQKAATSVNGLSDSLRNLDPALSAASIGLKATASAASAFGDSLENSSQLDDIISSTVSLGSAFREFRKSSRGLPGDIDLVGASLGKLRPRQERAVQNLLASADATKSYLQSLVASGKSSAEVRSEADRLRQAYVDQFRQLGFNETQIQKYLQTLELTPEAVDTALSVSGLEESRSKLEAYISLLQGKIPGSLAASVIASVEGGDVEGAAKQLADFAKTNPIDVPVSVTIDQPAITTAQDALDALEKQTLSLPDSFDAVTAALGGYTEEQTAGLEQWMGVGEAAQGFIATLIEGGDYKGAASAAQNFRDQLKNDVLPALGITDTAVQDYYISLIGLDGTTVETAIKLSGAEEALNRLGLYSEILKNLDSFSLQDQFKIADLIDQGKIDEAKALIETEITQGRAELGLSLPLTVDTGPASAGLQTFRDNVSQSGPVPQPVGANTAPADGDLDGFRNKVTIDLPFLHPFSLDISPALTVLDLFRQSVEKAEDFVIGLAFDVTGFFADVAKDLGVSVDIAKVIWGYIVDKIPGFATGGYITGPGTATSDSIPARLSAGEYVMDAATVREYGIDFFDSLRKRNTAPTLPGFSTGGLVSIPAPTPTPSSTAGGSNINYTVIEAKSRPTPEDMLRVTNSAVFLGASR